MAVTSRQGIVELLPLDCSCTCVSLLLWRICWLPYTLGGRTKTDDVKR